MIVKKTSEVENKVVEMEGANQVRLRLLVSEQDGAPNFNMRVFELAPGGHTPFHTHDFEHEIFVLEGEGELFDGENAHALEPGSVVLVAPNEEHNFRNTSQDGIFKFICIVPQEGKTDRCIR
jgi:quercetin dioxygenase-like cupin family protein